jgi:hypothetical protein
MSGHDFDDTVPCGVPHVDYDWPGSVVGSPLARRGQLEYNARMRACMDALGRERTPLTRWGRIKLALLRLLGR